MPLIEWNDSFLLGIQQFDEHHHHWIALYNKAAEGFAGGASNEGVDILLNELNDYANYHFAAEEYWMEKISYPKFAEHRDEHTRYSRRVSEMQKSWQEGNNLIMLELLSFMNTWITSHIHETDVEYGRFISLTQAVSINQS